MLRKLDEHNALFSLSREYPSRNSIIIINDSDNETSEKDEENASLSIIECSPTTLPSSSQQKSEKKELRKSPRQKNRSSITLSNLSIKQSSSTQYPCNGENIGTSIFFLFFFIKRTYLTFDTKIILIIFSTIRSRR